MTLADACWRGITTGSRVPAEDAHWDLVLQRAHEDAAVAIERYQAWLVAHGAQLPSTEVARGAPLPEAVSAAAPPERTAAAARSVHSGAPVAEPASAARAGGAGQPQQAGRPMKTPTRTRAKAPAVRAEAPSTSLGQDSGSRGAGGALPSALAAQALGGAAPQLPAGVDKHQAGEASEGAKQRAAGGASESAAGGASESAAGGASESAAGGASESAAGGASESAAWSESPAKLTGPGLSGIKERLEALAAAGSSAGGQGATEAKWLQGGQTGRRGPDSGGKRGSAELAPTQAAAGKLQGSSALAPTQAAAGKLTPLGAISLVPPSASADASKGASVDAGARGSKTAAGGASAAAGRTGGDEDNGSKGRGAVAPEARPAGQAAPATRPALPRAAEPRPAAESDFTCGGDAAASTPGPASGPIQTASGSEEGGGPTRPSGVAAIRAALVGKAQAASTTPQLAALPREEARTAPEASVLGAIRSPPPEASAASPAPPDGSPTPPARQRDSWRCRVAPHALGSKRPRPRPRQAPAPARTEAHVRSSSARFGSNRSCHCGAIPQAAWRAARHLPGAPWRERSCGRSLIRHGLWLQGNAAALAAWLLHDHQGPRVRRGAAEPPAARSPYRERLAPAGVAPRRARSRGPAGLVQIKSNWGSAGLVQIVARQLGLVSEPPRQRLLAGRGAPLRAQLALPFEPGRTARATRARGLEQEPSRLLRGLGQEPPRLPLGLGQESALPVPRRAASPSRGGAARRARAAAPRASLA